VISHRKKLDGMVKSQQETLCPSRRVGNSYHMSFSNHPIHFRRFFASHSPFSKNPWLVLRSIKIFDASSGFPVFKLRQNCFRQKCAPDQVLMILVATHFHTNLDVQIRRKVQVTDDSQSGPLAGLKKSCSARTTRYKLKPATFPDRPIRKFTFFNIDCSS
jgi:hypothetical protein